MVSQRGTIIVKPDRRFHLKRRTQSGHINHRPPAYVIPDVRALELIQAFFRGEQSARLDLLKIGRMSDER